MLAVSSLRNIKDDQNQSQMETFSIEPDDFMDFSDGNILDSINFDDIFMGINDEHVLPDLEMDPEILAEFSLSCGGEESERTSSPSVEKSEVYTAQNTTPTSAAAAAARDREEEEKQSSSAASDTGLNSGSSRGEKIMRKRDESAMVNPSSKETDKSKKSSAQSKNSQGKRKVKVDWTPELHRRFVQAVEQLGVDKAVPSRILEIMGIDCLTRHNIASHLQKYRSHRKHLLAREAEAASWSQRRQMYGVAAAPPANGVKRDASPWLAPTIGFPPMSHMHHFRPLHVWGHPTMDQSLMHMWPKHVSHSPPPPPPPPTVNPQPAWTPQPLATTTTPPDPSFWHVHHQRVPSPTTLTPVTPCFPQPFPTTRFASPPVPGIPHHHAMYKVNQGIGFLTGQSGPRPLFDFHPSKESIDAALGDILSKPWLRLPLGLKPPALESVMGELQRQGVPNIPPSSS